MQPDYRRILQRAFYPTALITISISLVLAANVVGLASAIKGGYVLLGILLAYGISHVPHATKGQFDANRNITSQDRIYLKAVVITWLLAISLAVLSGDRVYGLLFGLPLGYLLLGLQFRSGGSPVSLLLQTALLFSLSPITKYVTNGFIIGDGDIFDHIQITTGLMASGSISSLYRYADFPNFHLLLSMSSFNTGMTVYNTMMFIQISVYLTLILIMFLLTRAATGDEILAVAVALATSFVFYVSFYATLVFPQSVATALVAFLLFVAFRANNPNQHNSLSVIALLTGISIVLMHHLTVLLFVPLVSLLVVGTSIAQRFFVSEHRTDWRHDLRWLLLFIPGSLAVSYWIFERGFLGELVYFFFTSFVGGAALTEGELATSTIGLGQSVPAISSETALRSLFSPEGIYFILLVAVFVLGTKRLLDKPSVHPTMFGFCAAGILSAALVLRTPIAPDFTRLRLPLALFFAFVLALGLVKILRTDRIPLPVVLMVLISLGTLSPIVAGDDLYTVHTGESLYEQRPLSEPDREFNEAEYHQLRTVSELTNERQDQISTIWQLNKALLMFRTDTAPDPYEGGSQSLHVTDEGLTTERSLLVYQTRWPDHRHVHFSSARHSTLIMSDEWLEGTVTTENQIYSGGEIGILWRPEGGTFGSRVTDDVDKTDTVSNDRGDENEQHQIPITESLDNAEEDNETADEANNRNERRR